MTIYDLLGKVYESLTVTELNDWHHGNVVAVAWERDDQRSLPMILFNIRAEEEDRTHLQAILPAIVTVNFVGSNYADCVQKMSRGVGYLKRNICGITVTSMDDGYDGELKAYVSVVTLRMPVSLEVPPAILD